MVWSAGGSGGLTTAELDAALATQTTALDTSLVDELDSTSRNLLRVRSATITMANQSTTSVSTTKISDIEIDVQGGSPDFDYSTNFIMCAINAVLTVVDDTAGVNAYGKIKIGNIINGAYTAKWSGAPVGVQGTTPITFQYPIGANIMAAFQGALGYDEDITIELWGYTNGSGTAFQTDISFKYWSYRGA